MSHRTLAKIAILMLIVFGLTVLVYPKLFNPDNKPAAPALKVPPGEGAPLAPPVAAPPPASTGG